MSLGSLLCDAEGKPQAKLLLQILHYTATPTSQPGGPIRHIYTLPSVASPIPTLCGPCHKYQIRDRAVMHAPFSAPKHVGARLPHGPIPPLLPPCRTSDKTTRHGVVREVWPPRGQRAKWRDRPPPATAGGVILGYGEAGSGVGADGGVTAAGAGS